MTRGCLSALPAEDTPQFKHLSSTCRPPVPHFLPLHPVRLTGCLLGGAHGCWLDFTAVTAVLRELPVPRSKP